MQIALWAGFLCFVAFMLALDMGVLNRGNTTITMKRALVMTGMFVCIGALFGLAIAYLYEHNVAGYGARFVEAARLEGAKAAGVDAASLAAWVPPEGSKAAGIAANPGWSAATLYWIGWLVEYSLSIDNIFVIALIFTFFKVPAPYQHRVLFWGILGALVLRGVMIVVGSALVEQFHWLMYVFGAFLVFTAIKMAFGGGDDGEKDPSKSLVARTAKRLIPMTDSYDGSKFLSRMPTGALVATPLFLVLLIVETTDVVFAVDSIPAIFGITRDPFIIFTSNVFAIMGLRSLYFALSALMGKFGKLKYALAFILGFIGLKMLGEHWVEHKLGVAIPPWASLIVIVVSLIAGVVASLLLPEAPGNKDSGATEPSGVQ
jgi:tellurite resistance protein TerC